MRIPFNLRRRNSHGIRVAADHTGVGWVGGKAMAAASFATALVMVGGATTALADALGTTANPAGDSIATVSSCGALAGLTFTYTVSSGDITQVVVAGIPSGCQNGTATLYLGLQTSSTIAYHSSQAIGSGASSVTFSSISGVAISAVTSVDVAVVGK